MHRKRNLLMQVGGHIELDETPWQAIAHELREECGYTLDDLRVLQPDAEPINVDNVIMHPMPVFTCTYKQAEEHYHSDLSWAFVTDHKPKAAVDAGESDDLRWLTLAELREHASQGSAAKDVAKMYELVVNRYVKDWHQIPANRYSVAKPQAMSM